MFAKKINILGVFFHDPDLHPWPRCNHDDDSDSDDEDDDDKEEEEDDGDNKPETEDSPPMVPLIQLWVRGLPSAAKDLFQRQSGLIQVFSCSQFQSGCFKLRVLDEEALERAGVYSLKNQVKSVLR